MAPIRRYLRITKSSVLEVRIYLDNPADAQRWLLKPDEPALPRVIEAVRPLVPRKLREENERSRKGNKKKGVKDVVTGDDFEVSIFLTELSASHAILSKQKTFIPNEPNDDLGTKDAPVEVGDGTVPAVLQEEEDDDTVEMSEIPQATADPGVSDAESEAFGTQPSSPPRPGRIEEPPPQDEKKKLGFKTTYEGFQIWGRILCLVVKRKGTSKGKKIEGTGGQAMMEDWISSTQAAQGAIIDE